MRFGEVLFFKHTFDTFLYYSAYRVGKDLGKDLEICFLIWNDFGLFLT